MLSADLIDSLFPADLPTPQEMAARYPARSLPPGAQVTRFAPSPTGWLHIGGIFTASVNFDLARHSGGRYLLRIEDTDQARFSEGALAQFEAGFEYFGIAADESDAVGGAYGPYTQSARAAIYHTYVRELLRQGKAYPCFETTEQAEARVERQKAVGALPGYYGDWAIWRDAPEDQVRARLAAGDPYVVRFRSPGIGGARVSFTDEIRGELSADDNRNDVVILKRSDAELRLPTYHFAHAVDDHLMGITLVVRGEEWISSVPLHLQLFDALGFPRIPYAHVAPLMKQDGGSRRKLSKRKDPEASVGYYLEQGFPAEAVLYYLRGLANGRLAEMPLPQALAEPLRLAEFGVAGPLLDMVKLDDVSADYVATLPSPVILERLLPWLAEYDKDLAAVVTAERDLALRALDVERVDTEKPRKDLRKWADFRTVYGFFFPEVYELVTDPADERFNGLAVDKVRAMASGFAAAYVEPGPDVEWFDQIRNLAGELGFALRQKDYKKNPEAFPGSIADAAAVIRVLVTGSRQSPDLAQTCAALGRAEVLRRVTALG
ncbi:glutamate--tRNA ligase [Trebonia kvetii]|uniref:Glutamate--tRNA ligase n=1 Tax=Trebonia kvetii TaxID=2480626 RepID=A0A6P2C9E0_9ACTN|nr:glutamate--tRNA ligase [Trebonia kvetii]TVZ06173.1 glutamate--tRNA ligase [Trebonia kvetii]